MLKVAVVGAGGSLGGEILRQAVRQHEVTAVVRDPSKLAADGQAAHRIEGLDLDSCPVSRIAEALAGHDAVINAAGHVADGQRFVDLFGRVANALESLPVNARPVCWFLGGAAVLDVDQAGLRAVDLPVVRSRYWPHASNQRRLAASNLDWRMLCPGPLVAAPGLGTAPLRASIDRLPVAVPAWALKLPRPLLTLAFARLVPQMIIPYADAAAFILENLSPGGALTGRRVGLALPAGMRGSKRRWSDARGTVPDIRP